MRKKYPQHIHQQKLPTRLYILFFQFVQREALHSQHSPVLNREDCPLVPSLTLRFILRLT